MKLYLIEAYNPDMKFDEHSLIVALTPEVCYHLDKAGIDYSIIEDYYDGAELFANEDEYYESQTQWIGELEEFLQNNVEELKELKLELASIYRYYLKTYVLDPLYIHCYTLRRLFERVKPSEIAFVSLSPGNEALNLRLEDVSQSYYSRIIPLYCREKDIRLTSVFVSEKDRSSKRAKPLEVGGSFASRLKRRLAKSEIARSVYYNIYFIYKYLGSRPFLSQGNQEKLSIFIFRGTYYTKPYLESDALIRGHNVYELANDFIVKRHLLGTKKHFCYQKNSVNLDNVWEHTANLLETSDLITRISEQCQLDVSEIILPRLRHFVSQVCPEILRYFKIFAEFYEKETVDFILAPYAMSLVELGALAAADSKDINRVCLVHGDDVSAAKWRGLMELQNFNILIPSNRETKENYEYLAKANNISTELYVSPHRLLNVKRIKQLREKEGNRIKAGRIIYLTALFMWDSRRLDSNCSPDTWYYKFQKSLIEYFSTKSNYTFVWKGLPQSDAIYNPIPDFIKDSDFTNIEIAANPFVEHLLSADRVICDVPSTGFYESVIAGVPTMSLYHKALRVRKSAVDYFGNLLKLYSDIPEAIKYIDEFLGSDPELYKTTIDTEGESVLDILEEIGKESR